LLFECRLNGTGYLLTDTVIQEIPWVLCVGSEASGVSR